MFFKDGLIEFEKIKPHQWNSFSSRYDIKSILQYEGTTFSKNGLPTILDKR